MSDALYNISCKKLNSITQKYKGVTQQKLNSNSVAGYIKVFIQKAFLILLFGCFVSTGHAQTAFNQVQDRITLQDAVNIALQKNLDIKIARNNLEASIINNDISVAGGIPTVGATGGNTRTLTNLSQELSNGTKTQRNNVANSNLSAGLQGDFVLFNGFRVQAAKTRLAALERQSDILVNSQIQNVVASVMVNYYDIVRQQGYLKTIDEALQVTLQRKRLIEIKQSVGLANNADRFQAELDSTAGVQDLRSQQLILDQSKASLMNLLLQRPDSNYNIADTIIVDTTIGLATIMDRLKLSPDLLSAEQQIRINELIVKEVGAQRYPSVAVNGGYNFNRSKNGAGLTLLNQTSGPFVGLSLSVPIFNGGLYKRQQRVAEIDTRNARYTKTQLLNNLQTSVVRAFQAYQNNLTQLKTERENNKTAAALLDIVYKRYELGVGTVIDLRVAQQSFQDAGFRLVNVSYAAKIAEIELKRLSSNLP